MMEVQVAHIINNLANELQPMIIVNANMQYTKEYIKQVNKQFDQKSISHEMKILLLALIKPNQE